MEEELVQALEQAYPAPQPFSLDWFSEEWIGRIVQAKPEDRPSLVAQANEILRANGDKYEVWLGEPGSEDAAGSVVFGSKGTKAMSRRKRSDQDWGLLRRYVLSNDPDVMDALMQGNFEEATRIALLKNEDGKKSA